MHYKIGLLNLTKLLLMMLLIIIMLPSIGYSQTDNLDTQMTKLKDKDTDVRRMADESSNSWTPLQLGLCNPVQLFREDWDVKGLSTSILYGKNRNVYGLDLGGAYHKAKAVYGLQIGAIINSADELRGFQIATGILGANCASDAKGFQIAWVGNLYNYRMKGFQIAVGGNIAGYLEGIQIGGINKAKQMSGVQLGLLSNFNSYSYKFKRRKFLERRGIQITSITRWIQISPFFNAAKKIKGIQIGLVNYSKQMTGIQIGAINIIKENKIPIFPLINASFSF